MNTVLKIFLSMSVSGGLLILIMLLGKRFLQNKISRQWQYYIWLVVVLRLLLPFGPEINLMGKTYQAVDLAITQNTALPQQNPTQSKPVHNIPEGTPAVGTKTDNENVGNPTEDLAAPHPLQDIWVLLTNHIWLVWLVAALGMLIRKITIYQGFVRYINAGLSPVSDMELLDRLSMIAEQSGVKRPIELCVNLLVSSPLLIGFFHPCIVLPSIDIPEKDFRYIVLHELTHYKRRDMFYKWLVQITVCLHWFNPLAYIMGWEIARACEFSCDESVLAQTGYENAQDYGKTLLDAMAAVGKYKENPGTVTLSENKQLLKERLGAIMNFKRKPAANWLLTGVLTLCMILGAAFVGIYPVVSATNDTTGNTGTYIYDENSDSGWYLDDKDWDDKETPAQAEMNTHGKNDAVQAEQYYKSNSLPLFQIAFSRLDEENQNKWLDRLYADQDLTFMAAAVNLLDEDCAQIQHLAETIYKDGNFVYFSALTNHMSEKTLESWLERALTDENWAFQSVLSNALDWDYDELEELQNKAWAETQMAEYGTVGVTFEGKSCYYQGQLVNIFLDIRANKSSYTLDMNPLGTVNIKIIRDTNDNITGVAYMTETEVTELLTEPFGTNMAATPSVTPDEQHTKTNVSLSSQQSNDWKDEFDWDKEKDEKWEEIRRAEYHEADITVDGKDYYYHGQLVNIFMDIRANQSYYTLDMNPNG